VDAFLALGYSLYRLVPGLRSLVPFKLDANESLNLNIFAAKQDCAERLAARGLLVLQSAQPSALSLPVSTDFYRQLPYARALADRWQGCESAQTRELEAAFAMYHLSRDESRDLGERYVALEASFQRLYAVCQETVIQETDQEVEILKKSAKHPSPEAATRARPRMDVCNIGNI
jgi:hypothetical protein